MGNYSLVGIKQQFLKGIFMKYIVSTSATSFNLALMKPIIAHPGI